MAGRGHRVEPSRRRTAKSPPCRTKTKILWDRDRRDAQRARQKERNSLTIKNRSIQRECIPLPWSWQATSITGGLYTWHPHIYGSPMAPLVILSHKLQLPIHTREPHGTSKSTKDVPRDPAHPITLSSASEGLYLRRASRLASSGTQAYSPESQSRPAHNLSHPRASASSRNHFGLLQAIRVVISANTRHAGSSSESIGYLRGSSTPPDPISRPRRIDIQRYV